MAKKQPPAQPNPSEVLSTKAAARICKVALSTIVYWYDKGLIRGYRTPGGHRRMFRSDLEAFMREHSIPTGDRLLGPTKVLALCKSPESAAEVERVTRAMPSKVDAAVATSPFQAGRLLVMKQPELLIVEDGVVGSNPTQILEELAAEAPPKSLRVLLLTGKPTGTTATRFVAAGGAGLLKLPLSDKELKAAL